MRIAIVVHGRFYAFDLARALIRRGHDVTVFTNYPKRIARRFGLPAENVVSCVVHGVLARAALALSAGRPGDHLTALVHRSFGRWAARRVMEKPWDVIHVFSGVAEEILSAPSAPGTLRQVVRGSAHIRVQDRILAEEAARAEVSIDRPRPWTIARETREYELADEVIVLSDFARRSFLECGVVPEKLRVLPLGVDTQHFRASPEVLAERCRRIRAGEPLRVLTVGNLSYQKGILDLAEIVRALSHAGFRFRLVGHAPRESGHVLAELRRVGEVVSHRPQAELPRWYADADLFVFPTIQDGFAVVLAQAHASALPILTTTNCSGPDIVIEGETGWVLPIRSPEAFIERLRWCDAHREELANMVMGIHQAFQPRDWDDVARDFERLVAPRRQAAPVN
jgi:glycosyltransferase involved in cell wall biosynthesis